MTRNCRTFLISLGLIGLLLSGPLSAASSKRIVHSIEADNFDSVQLEVPVGELDIEIYEGDTIELDIDIESERSWFSLRRRGVDDIDVDQRARGEKLYLGIDRDNLEQHWRVRMPAALALEIEVGVGDVRVDDLSNSLELEIGVGAARVDVNEDDYRQIHLSAGVGDAVLRGFSDGSDNERSFISADAYYRGDGEHEIEIEVGVGDVEVQAN